MWIFPWSVLFLFLFSSSSSSSPSWSLTFFNFGFSIFHLHRWFLQATFLLISLFPKKAGASLMYFNPTLPLFLPLSYQNISKFKSPTIKYHPLHSPTLVTHLSCKSSKGENVWHNLWTQDKLFFNDLAFNLIDFICLVDTVFCLPLICMLDSENLKNINFLPWGRENI